MSAIVTSVTSSAVAAQQAGAASPWEPTAALGGLVIAVTLLLLVLKHAVSTASRDAPAASHRARAVRIAAASLRGPAWVSVFLSFLVVVQLLSAAI